MGIRFSQYLAKKKGWEAINFGEYGKLRIEYRNSTNFSLLLHCRKTTFYECLVGSMLFVCGIDGDCEDMYNSLHAT